MRKLKEDRISEGDIGWAIKMPNKMYYGYTWTKDINDAAIFETEQEARNEFRRINDGSKPFKLVKVDLGGWNGYEVLGEKPLKESKKIKESESKEIPGMKWFKDGPVFKPHFLSGAGVDAVAVDNYVDELVKEHNNRFVIDAPNVTEELYFEIQSWDTGSGDNVYVDILFNREFDRTRDENKWGKKSYGATNEHGYVEDWLNDGGLEKLGIADAKITGVGWDDSKQLPRWSIELFTFSDRNIDGTFKRPNLSDSWSSSHSINGTEPFTLEEGEEISKAVMNYIVELLKANPKRVYYKPSDAVTTVDIPEHRLHSYGPSWKGSYTHNTGWFGFSCYIEDVYDENATNWRGNKGDYYRADEDIITKLLEDKAAETLNDFLYEFNLEVVPDGCKASWYHGSEEDEKYGVLFEVSIKFKEIGIDSEKSYYAHTGNSFKDYWPGSEPKDIYKGKTFKRNPKKVKSESKNLKEGVVLHFDLEDGTHKAIPFNSEEEALEYMDSDDFPIGEWVGDYRIETTKPATAKPSGDDYDYKVLKPEDVKKLDKLVKEIKDQNEDGWCDWISCAIEIGRKYLGESLARYGEGKYTPFEDLINECETFVYYKTANIDKLLDKRLAFQNEENQLEESTDLKERVLDYDQYDKYYKEGWDAYFQGYDVDAKPLTGNAWFSEAWDEGWKAAKDYDDYEAMRMEAEMEDEMFYDDFDSRAYGRI